MAQDPLAKQANALVTLFVSLWTDKYKRKPTNVNRYRDKWGFQDMIGDLGYDRSREIMEYYFKTSRAGHPLQYLLYNYEKLDQILREIEEDEVNRAELRAATEKRVREWEQKNGNARG